MRIRLTTLWARGGANIAKGAVLDTDAAGIFGVTSQEARMLLDRHMAEVLPDAEPAPVAEALESAQSPDPDAALEVSATGRKRRGVWQAT